MFGSTVLEVAAGLTFCYASVALIVSTVQEALASLLRLRARTLLSGIKSMLGDPNFNALARAVYGHALVSPRIGDSLPSYIAPRNFAIALIETLQTVPGAIAHLKQQIDTLDDPQLRRALQGIYERAAGDAAGMEIDIALWFDSAMERVSVSYKRRSMAISLLLSLLLAVLFNIDSIHLFRSLWQHPALTAQLAAVPDTMNAATIDALFQLPIGWHTFPPRWDQAFVIQLAGWLITAATALFGAPFWFNLMKRTMQLRDHSAKP
ncbi:hypothetical protein [Massilia sp. CF038]|uniref:hypothetical protein n=1 Tax=Massilia sp. CF038 TaxID=1881045 RepID=UPI0009236D71|nr:hypothetical protein [Massilia sp. CF038]SHH67522.1 hypothetical protein SAMN05428948_4892 [Massilia sp. CF038]